MSVMLVPHGLGVAMIVYVSHKQEAELACRAQLVG